MAVARSLAHQPISRAGSMNSPAADTSFTVEWCDSMEDESGAFRATRSMTLAQVGAALEVGIHSLYAADGSTYWNQADQPFLNREAGDDTVEKIEVVTHESCEDGLIQADQFRWIDAPPHQELNEDFLAATFEIAGAGQKRVRDFGVRLQGKRVACEVDHVLLDEEASPSQTWVLAPLPREFDVWFSYDGALTVNGRPTTPVSVWLHSDAHTPLQPVVAGESFDVPAVVYAPNHHRTLLMHLCFELDDATRAEIIRDSKGAAKLEFSATAGVMSKSGRNHSKRLASHLSEGEATWAIHNGKVSCCAHAPRFLATTILVLSQKKTFSLPAPHLFEYSLEEERTDGLVLQSRTSSNVAFDRRCKLAAPDGPWHYVVHPDDSFRVVRKKTPAASETEPWAFALFARPRCDELAQMWRA